MLTLIYCYNTVIAESLSKISASIFSRKIKSTDIKMTSIAV